MSQVRVRQIAAVVAFLAASVWMGGLAVLGAVVAPIVFSVVPAPTSADAMTRVFQTFDKIAMSAAAILAITEVVRMRFSLGAPDRFDNARLGVAVLAGACAIAQGVWLSPMIVDLHVRGAVRGLGEMGLALERAHAWSERCAKTELLLVAVFVVLLVRAVGAGAKDSRHP